MPTQETVTETYWTWCYKKVLGVKIPYPCKKSRTVTRWCYQFKSVHIHHWLFYCTFEGCEAGTLYKWGEACFGLGSTWVYDVRKCFDHELDSAGTC